MNRLATPLGLSVATVILALVPSYAMADPTAAPGPASAPGSTATTTPASTGSEDQAVTVTVSTPASAHSAITVTVTGLREGQWIDIDGHPDGWTQEAPYHKEVQQRGSGPVATQLDAPQSGWPDGTYRWIITLPDGTSIHRSFTFTRHPQPDQNPDDKNKAPREKTRGGGLANTGV